jgi:hypothetical protein
VATWTKPAGRVMATLARISARKRIRLRSKSVAPTLPPELVGDELVPEIRHSARGAGRSRSLVARFSNVPLRVPRLALASQAVHLPGGQAGDQTRHQSGRFAP